MLFITSKRLALLASALVFSLALAPRPASAMPTFAQAYGVDCSACHTMVPALNAYGRYIQASALGVLEPSVMKRAAPFVVRESVSYRSTGKLDRTQPTNTYTYANLSANLVGVLNKYVSYRFEQSFYSNNVSGQNTGHFWASYNQLFKGNGHVIVGKFDAPSAPAFSYWSDGSGFSSPSVAVGQHNYALSGSRWGIGFSYVPLDYAKLPYRVQLAYLGNGNSMANGYTFDTSNPYAPGTNGSDKEFAYKVAWARPDNPVEAGVYGSSGTYALKNGYVNPIDNYNALGLYAQRDPVGLFPGLVAFYQQTNDSNVGPGKASQHLVQSGTSWAYGVELDESLLHGNVMLGLRPVEYVRGLQASKSGYDVLTTAHPHYGVFDIVMRDPQISPYLYVTAESAFSAASNTANAGPTWKVGIKWASPVFP